MSIFLAGDKKWKHQNKQSFSMKKSTQTYIHTLKLSVFLANNLSFAVSLSQKYSKYFFTLIKQTNVVFFLASLFLFLSYSISSFLSPSYTDMFCLSHSLLYTPILSYVHTFSLCDSHTNSLTRSLSQIRTLSSSLQQTRPFSPIKDL